MSDWPYWFEIGVICSITAVGNVVWAHWEEQTSKWWRVGKIPLTCALAVFISSTFGRFWFYVMLGVMGTLGIVLHAWWLPRKGINGWTAEPREKYYALRGWKWPPDKT